jgi:hypothetical protein
LRGWLALASKISAGKIIWLIASRVRDDERHSRCPFLLTVLLSPLAALAHLARRASRCGDLRGALLWRLGDRDGVRRTSAGGDAPVGDGAAHSLGGLGAVGHQGAGQARGLRRWRTSHSQRKRAMRPSQPPGMRPETSVEMREFRDEFDRPRLLRKCSGGDLNPHALRHTPLKRTCLPFHHPSLEEGEMCTSPAGARKSSLRVFFRSLQLLRCDFPMRQRARSAGKPLGSSEWQTTPARWKSEPPDFPLRNCRARPKKHGTNLPICFEIRP